MPQAPLRLQDLRRRIYVKAQAAPCWRFWGLCAPVCTRETRWEASRLAKDQDGAPGSDGGPFAALEAAGGATFLEQRRDERVHGTYRPTRSRRKAVPAMRDRVVQGALKLILEPIFEADFQEGSYGYRPKRSAHDAVARVAEAIVHDKTRVLDIDLQAYCDTLRHHRLLAQGAPRGNEPDVRHVCKLILQNTGKKGVAQGDGLGPL